MKQANVPKARGEARLSVETSAGGVGMGITARVARITAAGIHRLPWRLPERYHSTTSRSVRTGAGGGWSSGNVGLALSLGVCKSGIRERE